MSQWSSTKAKRVLAALLRIGWSIKRETGSSHKILEHPELPDVVYGKDIDDAVRQCKQEIDKLLSPESGRGRAMIED